MNSQAISDARKCMPRAEVLTFPSQNGFDEYPSVSDPAAFRAYFEREGFICIRQAVPKALCEKATQAFLTEVLPARRQFFLRHESGRMERHVYTEQGFMKYPIMNLQDISNRRFGSFKQSGLDILTQPKIQDAVQILFNEPGRMVHSMYFDGNQVTWAHRDGHYLDTVQPGGMIGIWVAAEDIHPDAGRFYIVPRSHRMAVPGEQINPNGPDYKARMAAFVKSGPLECVAPILRQGDILLWSSLTIHGSLPTTAAEFPRRSFTAHYIPGSQQFAWLGGATSARVIYINDVPVTLHDAQHTFKKNLVNSVEAVSPQLIHCLRQVKKRLRH